jgi:AP-2 complex subunit mu-1
VQVPMFAASGIRVQYLKVWDKSGYKVDKWVRKVCKSGDYNVRIT